MPKIDLSGLNPAQRAAAMHVDGPARVISVAGSGKTTTAVNRLGYLAYVRGIKPESILFTTFSVDADAVTKNRIALLYGRNALYSFKNVGTFHSLGLRMLKDYWKGTKDPLFNDDERKLLNRGHQTMIVIDIMKVAEINKGKSEKESIHPRVALAYISTCKNSLVTPEEAREKASNSLEHDLAFIYGEYEDKKKDMIAIDFDDMLYKLHRAFVDHPSYLNFCRRKFDYVMADEAQDLNLAQITLLKLLAHPRNNIMVIGDDDQCIYPWRGAVPEFLINFLEEYQALHVDDPKNLSPVEFKLEFNYRSEPSILELANKNIAHNTVRLDKTLQSGKPNPNSNTKAYSYFTATDQAMEAETIANEILESIENHNRMYSDHLVLIRIGAQGAALEDALIARKIPYISANSFYKTRPVLDLHAYCCLAVDPNNDEAFTRVVNTPTRFLGKAFMNVLYDYAGRNNCSLYQAACRADLEPRQRRNVNEFLAIIDAIHEMANQQVNPGIIISEVRNLTKYDDFIKKDEGDSVDDTTKDNLDTLVNVASKYPDLKEFTEYITHINNTKEKPDAVVIKTIHRAKGDEFPVVFVAGLSQGVLPNYYAIESGDPIKIEEERRLFHVAITRAKDMLYISSPRYFNNRYCDPSDFLYDAELETKA